MVVCFRFRLHSMLSVLSQGFKASASSIINLAIGFVAICFDITLVQMPEVDQKNLTKLDRLLRTTRRINPGTSALRGPFGTVDGIIRARRRSQIWGRSRPGMHETLPPGTMVPCGPSRGIWLSPGSSTSTEYHSDSK
ncbi:hypothetical protein GYMLUDRAFT_404449 [Collybiopsis luxurians FD-317 M1]|uniref:Unplaced genomic scaffold GYMLUscaffold_120, whole genome shotgun sequence n=1 Tax=Collybiopsis luxurians FD-317 M1 TaxID=944289 RepID=A0A0D0ALZ4_9AGAR|nr:hypothetical protein GYMLUDRAFT_404449 [Collybiopsis luxurians FD-317 M1]